VVPSNLINPMILIQISISFANGLTCPHTGYFFVKHHAALPHFAIEHAVIQMALFVDVSDVSVQMLYQFLD